MTNIQNGTIGTQMEKVASKNTRIETVDALRGFAVMAIVLVHNLEHFIFPVYPENTPAWLNVLDQGVSNVVFSLFAGKAYAIFALLFGFTFYIQWNNRKLSGKDFSLSTFSGTTGNSQARISATGFSGEWCCFCFLQR